MMKRFECHSHSMFSNVHLIDSTNKPEKLIDKAIELGLAGIAITDHECLSASIQINKYASTLRETNPDFKVAIGNEIYLVDERPSDEHYHFILIAKDAIGHRQLRELSSIAWLNAYHSRGRERTDTLKSDLENVVKKNKGHLIASTACLGSELDKLVLRLIAAEKAKNEDARVDAHNRIINFILWCKDIFADDFYIECQPAKSKEQIAVNGRLLSISQCFGVKMIVTTDAHYLTKEDRYVHKAFLNSKQEEREVDAFYEYAYLQPYEDIIENLKASNYDDLFIEHLFANSLEIYDKIEFYDLTYPQQIPNVEVTDYPKSIKNEYKEYPNFCDMFNSDDKIERYWANQCLEGLKREFGNNIDKKYFEELEEEADVKRIIGKKLNTNMFGYPVLLQHYIDFIWECGSTIGAGRGSACSALNHYLLGITQLDPLKWNFPFFRYMNRDTDSLGDIDIDVCSGKRPAIIRGIKEERASSLNPNLPDIVKKNLGCTQVATFGTETTKSAIQTACRGYRSEEYPMGIDVDTAHYLSSLIPSERGFLWPLKDVINGNKEKDRKPVTAFLTEVNLYPGLLETIKGIEGLISSKGIHASGIIMFDKDPYEHCCFMKAASGEVITQYELHDAEAAGMTKLDLLVTEVQDKITETIRILQKKGKIDESLSLRQAYDRYLHPKVLDIEDKEVWDVIQRAASLDLFQLDSEIGRQGAKKVKPTNMIELSSTNGLIRLMGEKDKETPMDKYCRFKKDINEWRKEMDSYGLTDKERAAIIPYLEDTCGIGISQEQLMRVLMDPGICNYSLKDANKARKVVSKKKMDQIADFKKKVWETAVSENMAQYVWDAVVAPGLGYSFSDIHSLSYSYVGYQTAYLATHWNPIYWNTACLMVNSGSLDEEEEEEIVNIFEEEDEDSEYEDLPDRSGKKKKTKSTDYAKLANAISVIRKYGTKVSLIDINASSFGFEADDVNNEIIFGLKGANKVGDDVAKAIISGRPYSGIIDFMRRCPLNKTVMISLIKAGAFDKLDSSWASKICSEPRHAIMAYYISQIADTKKKLNMQNFNGLIQNNLIPEQFEGIVRTFNFNKYLKTRKKGLYYNFDSACLTYYSERFDIDKLEVINGVPMILQKTWDAIYKKEIEPVKSWLIKNQDAVLNMYNSKAISDMWKKSADGNISSWEMESLCFYYHKHELADINTNKYGISDFNKIKSEDIEKFYKRGGREIPIYRLHKIIGTVLSKNDNRSLVTLLTPTGVVNVKFSKEQYAKYKRQISQKNEAGVKKVIEKSWFTRGRKLMITGFRRDDQFVAKTYANTPTHQIYLITDINGGDMILQHERAGEEG